MRNIYQDGTYLEQTGSWHAEDSTWKAKQIAKILRKIDSPITSITEVGCGAGRILYELSKADFLQSTRFHGFDISPQAIALCEQIKDPRIEYVCSDPLAPTNHDHYDALLAIDVFEHVPDYIGFLEKCQRKARFKIYHIPLDLNASNVIRKRLTVARQRFGHLHYFTAETALATLEDTHHRIIDWCYTDSAIGLFKNRPSLKGALVNVPRWMIARVSTALAARLLGGYSLLVLAE